MSFAFLFAFSRFLPTATLTMYQMITYHVKGIVHRDDPQRLIPQLYSDFFSLFQLILVSQPSNYPLINTISGISSCIETSSEKLTIRTCSEPNNQLVLGAKLKTSGGSFVRYLRWEKQRFMEVKYGWGGISLFSV